MLRGIMFAFVVASMILSEPVIANERGFFVGVDVSGANINATSNTTDGGAAFAGGGIVKNVDFGSAMEVGGYAGYRLGTAWSTFISYRYSHSDISWDAIFPVFDVASGFSGSAITHMILGNVAYDFPLTPKTTARITAGVGVSSNSLSRIVEKDKYTATFLSDVRDHTQMGLVERVGLGFWYRTTKNVMLGIDASVTHLGGFRTGDTRSGNLGITDITPYRINDAWSPSLGTSIQVSF